MNNLLIFLVGMWTAAVILGALNHKFPKAQIVEYNKAIIECERDLPRNQFCKIIAVPVEVK